MSLHLTEPSPIPPLLTDERLGERTCVVTVRGYLDGGTAPALRDLLREAVAEGARDFVIDLSEVAQGDTSGTCALVDARRHLLPEDAEVVVATADDRMLHLLEMVDLTALWPVEDTRADALARLLRGDV